MNLTALFAALFPSLFDAAAAKIIHQVAGSAKGDDILQKDGAAIQALQQVAQPYIAQQVGVHLAAGTTPNGLISLAQFLPASVQGTVAQAIHISIGTTAPTGGIPQ